MAPWHLVLGTIAAAYGVLNLLAALMPRAAPGLSLFLIAGLLQPLGRIDPALASIPGVLLSLPFIAGSIGLLAGKPAWGQRTVGIAAGVCCAVLAVGFLLSSVVGILFLTPLLGPFAARLFQNPVLNFLRLLGTFGFAPLPAAVPLVPMWLAASGRPRWLRGEFARINGKVWTGLLVLSVLSGPVLFLVIWVTASFTRTAGHRLYAAVMFIQAAVYLLTVATSRKWWVIVLLLLLLPFVAGSVVLAGLYAACFFFGDCL